MPEKVIAYKPNGSDKLYRSEVEALEEEIGLVTRREAESLALGNSDNVNTYAYLIAELLSTHVSPRSLYRRYMRVWRLSRTLARLRSFANDTPF